MGRKVFQPELNALSEKLSRQAVNIFKRYIHLMREDSGAPSTEDATALFNWRIAQIQYLKEHPLEFVFGGRSIGYASVPRSEQDVIAIFHELFSIGLLKGYRFLSTSQIDRYDSCFQSIYAGQVEYAYSRGDNVLGVGAAHVGVKELLPSVLEFKWSLDGLIADFAKEVKYDSEIQLVVCWEIGEDYREKYQVNSLLIGEEGTSRQCYGSTHSLSHERQKKFEIICIKDLMDFLRNPDVVVAEHQTKYQS